MKVFSDTSQGGSVAGFLVVGVVLVVLAVGGVYLAQQREGDSSGTGPVVTNNDADEKAKEENQKPTSSPAASPSNVKNNTESERKALPETGPADSLLGIFAVAVLSGFIVAYIQSSVRYRYETVQR